MRWGQSRKVWGKVWAKSWKEGPVGEKGFGVLSILTMCLRSLGPEAMKSLSEIMGRGRERAWDSGLGVGTGQLRARASDLALAANGDAAAGARSRHDDCLRCFLGCGYLFAGLQVFVDPTQHLETFLGFLNSATSLLHPDLIIFLITGSSGDRREDGFSAGSPAPTKTPSLERATASEIWLTTHFFLSFLFKFFLEYR